MVALPTIFDPNQVPPASSGGKNLPPSHDAKGHLVHIVDDEIRETADKTGSMLVFTLEILDGPHQGVQGEYRLNTGNTNATAVRIAYQQLSSICHVCNYLQPLQDTAVLRNRPFRVIVALQSDKDAAAKGYTNITQVLDLNGNKPGHQSPPSPPAPPSAPVAPSPQPSGPPSPQWGVPVAQPQPQPSAQPQPGSVPPWMQKPA